MPSSVVFYDLSIEWMVYDLSIEWRRGWIFANFGRGMREPKAGVTISHAIHVPIHGSACWCAVCMGAVNSDGPHGYVLRGLVVYYCSDMNSDDCPTLCIVCCELVVLC